MNVLPLKSAQAAVLAVALAALLAIVVATHVALGHEYRRQVREVLVHSEKTAQKLAARTAEVFDRASESARLVAYLRTRPNAPCLKELQAAGVLAGDFTLLVVVADAAGRVLDSTGPGAAVSVADEDHFKVHVRDPSVHTVIAPVRRNPLDGRHGIPVSHRMPGPGPFGGVVVADIDPAMLSVRTSAIERPGTVIGVLGDDGWYRARSVDGRLSFGERVDARGTFERAERVRRQLMPVASPIDGVERFVTVLPVQGYPLFAVVAPDAQQALAGYREARWRMLGWAVALGAVTLAAAGLAGWQARRLDASRARIRHAEAVFRATLDGSMDAVTILRPVRNAEGALVDMRVEDCNLVAAQYAGRSRSRLVGQCVSQTVPGLASRGFLHAFEGVMHTRQLHHAEVMVQEPPMRGRWLHHQVVPIDDGVALISRDVTEQRQAREQLEQLARVDTLTGLVNRLGHEEALQVARARAKRSGGTLALLYLDLDGFKAVNDTHGHAVGDRVLMEVAARLRAELRETDTVCRLGGDEFTVVAENAGTAADVRDLCERLLRRLSQPHEVDGLSLKATPSIGCAVLRRGESAEALVERADAAMYRAKRQGKAGYEFDEADASHHLA